MKPVTVHSGQNLFDICIQEYGSIEALVQLAKDNGLRVDDQPDAGTVLQIDESKILKPKVVKYLLDKDIKPNSWSYPVPVLMFKTAPTTSGTTIDQTTITAALNMEGIVYIKVVADGDPAPSVAQIIADNEYSAIDSGAGVSIDIIALTGDTPYDIYVAAVDKYNDPIESAVLVEVATLDAIPPVFDVMPYIHEVNVFDITIKAAYIDSGWMYIKIVAEGSTAPTVAEIIQNYDNKVSPAGIIVVKLLNLEASTGYDIYFAAEDGAGNQIVNAVKLNATTQVNPLIPVIINTVLVNITETTMTLNCWTGVDATVYVKVVAAGAPAPSVATIIADDEFSAPNLGTISDILLSGLIEGTSYEAYVAAIGTVGGYQSLVAGMVSGSTVAADVTAPVATFDPLDGAVDVPSNKIITISFDEPVFEVGGGELTNANIESNIFVNENNPFDYPIPFSATINTEKTVVTITLDSDIPSSQVVHVSMQEVEDASGNAMGYLPSATFTAVATSSVVVLATALTGNTDTVDLWLTNSIASEISWSTGVTTLVPISAIPVKYSHTYTGETPNITLTNQANITGITSNLTDNFTTTTAQINAFTTLTTFANINAIITGSINTIDNAIVDLSLGDQVGNDLLTGDIGTLLNNNPFTTLNLNGGDLTVSDVPISVEDGAFIYLKDNQLSDAEVDILIVRSVVGNPVIDLTIIGNTTGARTSASDTEYNQHITNGSTIELNGMLIGALTYLNTSQTVNVNVAITDMEDTSVVSSTSMYQAFNRPTGIVVDAATGAISGTPTVIDDYTLRIRKTGYGDYAGVEVIDILISVLA